MNRTRTTIRRVALLGLLVALFAAGSMAVGGSEVSPSQTGKALDFNNQTYSDDSVTVENLDSAGTPSMLLLTYEDGGDSIVAWAVVDGNANWAGSATEEILIPGENVPGEYTARILALGDRSQNYTNGDVLSSTTESAIAAQETATISGEGTTSSSLSGLDIAGQGADATIGTGAEENVSVVVENTGSSAASFEVSYEIPAGTIVNGSETTATLSPGQTETVTFENVTSTLDPGTVPVFVSTESDSVSGEVTVTGGPSLSNLDIAGQGTSATITPGADEDVTVEVTNIQDSSQSFDVDLSIGNAVSETETTTTLAPDASETVTFENVTSGLANDDYQVTVSSGQLSATGSLSVESANPPAGSLSNLDIAEQGTSATVTEGEYHNVSVQVENTGGGSGTIDVDLTIEDADGNTQVDQTETTGSLDPGQSATVVFEGVTSGLSVFAENTADYDVDVVTDDDSLTGGLTVEGTSAESALSNLNIAEQGQSATIIQGEDENVSVVVENVGDASGSFGVTLEITDLDGNPVRSEAASTGTLSPGGTETVTFESVTGGLGPGVHIVGVETAQDSVTGDVEVNEQVAESLLSGLDIAGQGTSATVVEGSDANIAVTVENNGTGAGTFDVSLDIAEGPTANVTETQTTSELDSGEMEVVTFENVTGGLDLAEYQVTVSTADDTVIGDLTVDTPESSALSSLDVAGQGTSATIDEGTDGDVSVDVENVGTAAGTFEVALQIGENVTLIESTGSLSPGQSQTITFADATGEAGPGTQDVTVSTDDDDVTGSLTVNADSVGSLSILDIADQGDDATIVQGEQAAVTVNVENTGSLTESISVTLTAGTATATESTSPLATGENETVTFPDLLPGLEPGSYAVEASTDHDSVTGNVTVQAPPESSLSALDVAGQGSSGSIVEGDTEDVSVDVGNIGGVEGEFDVTLEIGSAVTQTQSSGRVGAGANTTVTFIDVTGSLATGSYPVTVSTDNDTVTGDLTVAQPAESALSGLNIAGQGPESTVTEGALANLSVDVQNVGEETGTFDVTLLINGAVETEQTNPLAGGESQTVTFTNVNDGLAPGNYPAEVSTTDDTATGNMTVEAPAESSLSNLDVAGQGTNASVHEGAVENVTVDVENVGDQDGSFAVTLDVGGESWTESTGTLAGDATGTVTFDNVTGGLAVGSYSVDVSTADDALSGNLTVTPPPTATVDDLDIAEKGVEATIAQGVEGDVSVNVTHDGDNESYDVFPVTLAIGQTVEVTTNTSELRGTFSERVTFENVTGGLALGNYNVTVSTATDEVAGNLSVVQPPETTLDSLDIAGAGADATITEGDDEDVDVDVTNVGEIAGTFDVTLSAGGDYEETQTTTELQPGSSVELTFENVTGGLAVGSYDFTVETGDDSSSISLTVEALPADFQVSNLTHVGTIAPGSTIDVSGDIENVGGEGSQSVEVTIGSVSTSQNVTLAGGESTTVSFEGIDLSALAAGDFSVAISTESDEATGQLTIGDAGGGSGSIPDAFRAESSGGYLALGEDSQEAAESEGFALPPSDTVTEPIVLEGEIDGGTWQSTSVNFPPLDPSAIIGDADLPIDPSNIDVQITVPEGFSGDVDEDAGLMTLTGTIQITVSIFGETIPVGIELNGTTGESGGLTGDMNLQASPVTATLVDNETVVDALDEAEYPTVGPIINDQLGLPAAAGQTWLELNFELTSQ